MWNLIAITVLAWASADIRVTPLAGEPVTGQLNKLTADVIVVQTARGEQSFELKNIASVSPRTETPELRPKDALRVELTDGSAMAAENITASEGQATIRLVNAAEITCRTRTINRVRLKPASATADELWEKISTAPATGDVIVVRKMAKAADSDRMEIVLDRLEGVVHEITPDAVKFEFDGDRIDVRREKLEGVVFFQPVEREFPEPSCRVWETGGNVWNAKLVKGGSDGLEIDSLAGVAVLLPLSRLRKLDYTVGNTLFLSDLEPELAEWAPYIDSPATRERLAKLYGPRRDLSFDGGKLLLGGKSFEKGLALHSRTKLVYRVPKDALRFVTLVGIDDRLGDEGNVRLVISNETKTLLEQTITGRDEPVEINLDIAGTKRLTILVDFGANLDIADHLNLCNARITK